MHLPVQIDPLQTAGPTNNNKAIISISYLLVPAIIHGVSTP